MTTQKRPFFSTLAGRVTGSVVALLALLAVMYLTAQKPTGKGPVVVPPTQDVSSNERSDKDLARIIEGLQPGKLGISSDRNEMLSQLNSWQKKYIVEQDVAALTNDAELVHKILEGEVLRRVESELYLPEDASHIRECFLASAIVQHVTADLTNDTARAVALFEFVSNYISLLPPQASEVMTLTPYETLLFGVGTAADRTWTFASLLRQLRLEAVIVRPFTEEKKGYWLIGVIVPQVGVLMFDPHLGLPIPILEETVATPFPEQPATLKQIQNNDAILRQLDAKESNYPLTSSDLKKLHIQLIGSSSAWSSRMAELQFMLPTGVNVDLYDGLGQNALYQPGKIQRVIDAGEDLWTLEDITIWSFPDQQISRIEAARGVEGTELGNLLLVMAGPYITAVDPATGDDYQTTVKRSLHYVRIQQLMGEHAEALKNLFPIRTAANQLQLPANILANDYAIIWTGMCQFEQGKYSPALDTFQRYIDSHNAGENWTRVAYEWAAMSFLKLSSEKNNFQQAANLLTNAPRGFSGNRDEFLVKRWLKLGEIESPQTDATPDIKSEVEKKPKDETQPEKETQPESVEKSDATEPVTPKAESKSPEPQKPPAEETPREVDETPQAE